MIPTRLYTVEADIQRLERRADRHDARLTDAERRIDRIELRIVLLASAGGAAGALLGSAGHAAAQTLLHSIGG